MQEYVVEVKRTLLYIVFWGMLVSTGAYLSGFSAVLPGLLLGITTSVIYFLLMCYRVKKSAMLPPQKAVSYMRMGWLVRLSFVVLMLILSVRISSMNLWAAVVGLFSLHIVLFLNAVVLVVQEFTTKKEKIR